jgi:hypothetical protein
MSTVPEFIQLLTGHGSDVIFHRDDSVDPCPCLTPEGFRDPIWHLQNPDEPECNAAGMLPTPELANFTVKAFFHPVQAGAVRRLTTEQISQLFGEVEADDHLGIFPVQWEGHTLSFFEWGLATEDWVEYTGRKFTAVSVNLIPDPADGNPWHHWEVGFRLIKGQL